MATKKLRAELELDASKARQKVREIAETGGSAAVGGETAPTRDLQELGKAAKETGSNLRQSGRMFAGLAMGMARAATAGGSDPTTGAAIGAVGSVMAGAAMGGLPGAIAAAVVEGITAVIVADVAKSQKMEADAKTKSANLDAFKDWEEARKRTLDFKETLESLTSVETDLTDRQARLAEEIRKREEADERLAKEMIRESDDPAAFQRAMAKRQANAAELDQLRAIEKKKPSSSGGGADWKGVDSLDAVGGRFAGGGAWALPDLAKDFASPAQDGPADVAAGMEGLAAESDEVKCLEELGDKMDKQVDLLKKIAQKEDGGGVLTWQ